MTQEFATVFEKYIKGKKVSSYFSAPPYGDYKLPDNERYYGDGIEVSNGYKYISFGGGCSGEDCNVPFILNKANKVIARYNW